MTNDEIDQMDPGPNASMFGEPIGDLHAICEQARAYNRLWKPIETAPRDGTEIWAYNGEQQMMLWLDLSAIPEADVPGLWIHTDELLSDADPDPSQPTHWMPLPEPPEDSHDD